MTYSLDLRERVVAFISDGGSKSEAIRTFKISRDTIYRWLSMEDLHPKKHGQRNRKLDKKALMPGVIVRAVESRKGKSSLALFPAEGNAFRKS